MVKLRGEASPWYNMNVRLNKKHQRTLAAIFSTQTPTTLQWRRIEALFMALGATKEEGRGSSVTFKLKGSRPRFTDHILEKTQNDTTYVMHKIS